MKAKLMKFKIRIKHNQFKLLHNWMVIKLNKKKCKYNIFKSHKKWKIQKNRIKYHKNKTNKMIKNL